MYVLGILEAGTGCLVFLRWQCAEALQRGWGSRGEAGAEAWYACTSPGGVGSCDCFAFASGCVLALVGMAAWSGRARREAGRLEEAVDRGPEGLSCNGAWGPSEGSNVGGIWEVTCFWLEEVDVSDVRLC